MAEAFKDFVVSRASTTVVNRFAQLFKPFTNSSVTTVSRVSATAPLSTCLLGARASGPTLRHYPSGAKEHQSAAAVAYRPRAASSLWVARLVPFKYDTFFEHRDKPLALASSSSW